MKTKPVAHDLRTGITQWFQQEADGGATIVAEQDCTALQETNRALYADTGERAPWGNTGFVRVASVPLVLWEELRRTGILDDRAAFMKWLNDPDNRHFRTRPGRL